MSKLHKTSWTCEAKLISPSAGEFKAAASKIRESYGIDLKPQIDILYVKSCLVTAGNKHGWNENDDIFTVEEAWAARHSPLIKPANWQHKEKDIVGVVFNVQAYDLEGNQLDINSETPPDCEFEFYTEAAIFKLIHPDRANEIEQRAMAGNLFVSMEAWFDNYDYATLCEDQIEKVIARNESTAFLDGHLRSKGGSGLYENKKIGRVLKGITFGGYGFVDRPANKRSLIVNVDNQPLYDSNEQAIVSFLKEVLTKSEDVMTINTPAAAKAETLIDPVQIKGAVKDAMAEAAAESKRVADEKAAKERVSAIETKNTELITEVENLRKIVQEKDSVIQSFNDNQVLLDTLVKEVAPAVAEAPPEIKVIDAAKDGDAAFKAKLSFISKSAATLLKKAARADKLEADLAEAAKLVRANEVRAMYGEVVDSEVLEVLVSRTSALSDQAYQDWKEEHELVLLSAAGAKEKMMKEKEKKAKKEEEKEGSCASSFKALLEKRRSGAVAENAKASKEKIAGGNTENSVNAADLEKAEAEKTLNLAGASLQSGESVVNPFRALANVVVNGIDRKEAASDDKPSFDPVGN